MCSHVLDACLLFLSCATAFAQLVPGRDFFLHDPAHVAQRQKGNRKKRTDDAIRQLNVEKLEWI